MAGTVELARRVVLRVTARYPKVSRLRGVHGKYCSPLHGVLSGLLVTAGLFGGALAVMPPRIVEQLPMVHLAIAFFIPYSALFAFTQVNLQKICRVMGKGLLASLVIGCAVSVASSFVQGAETTLAGVRTSCLERHEFTCERPS